jgi:soluble lytic murein transglycosylase-like protein
MHHNHNSSADLGPMQINTSWWPKLLAYGITQYDVLYDPCVNIRVGTWILASAIADGKDLYSGIGDYNSHTKNWNMQYRRFVQICYVDIYHQHTENVATYY